MLQSARCPLRRRILRVFEATTEAENPSECCASQQQSKRDQGEPPYLESSYLSDEEVHCDHQYMMLLRRGLARNFTRQQILMSTIALFPFVMHSLFGEYDFIFTLGTLPADSRVVAYCMSAYLSTIICAASFPTSPTSTAGARFIYVPVVVGACLRAIGVCLDLYHTEAHVNVACTAVHGLTALVLICLWLNGAWLGSNHQFTWANARWVHGGEGTALVLCVLGLRACGPPPSYPPGNMSFVAALARGGLAMFLGIVLIAPPNRIRIASAANRLGLNHVTIYLHELNEFHSSQPQAHEFPSLQRDSSPSTLHTAKMPQAHEFPSPQRDLSPSTLHTAKMPLAHEFPSTQRGPRQAPITRRRCAMKTIVASAVGEAGESSPEMP